MTCWSCRSSATNGPPILRFEARMPAVTPDGGEVRNNQPSTVVQVT